jgi:hypothetical protein
MSFKESDGSVEPHNLLMRNGGTDAQDLYFTAEPIFVDKIYQESTSILDEYPFDGIACKEPHHSALISGRESQEVSYLSFDTISFEDKQDFTIEFWFRLIGSDSDYNSQDAHLFSVFDSEQ